MIWQSEALGLSYGTIAQNLNVDKSTVCRTLQLFHTTGNVTKKEYLRENDFRKLTSPAQLFILQLTLEKPGIYLHEIQRELWDFLQIDVNISTIYRLLHESGFTRQRLRYAAIQRDEMLRQQFILDVSVYTPEMLIFLDETGAYRRNVLRKYGYSMRGKPVVNHSLLVRGECVSAVAVISVCGLLDICTVMGSTNSDTFYDFVEKHLLPILCHLMVLIRTVWLLWTIVQFTILKKS